MIQNNQPIGNEQARFFDLGLPIYIQSSFLMWHIELESLRSICNLRVFFQMAHHTHSHAHSHSHDEKTSFMHASKTCRLGTVLILTIGFFFVELICGYILHSVAIVADAIHMLSDSGALIIAMVSVRVRISQTNFSIFSRLI